MILSGTYEITRKFTIDRKAVVEENDDVTNKISTINGYDVKVTYPIDAYQGKK